MPAGVSAYVPLANLTVATTAASVTFSSISQSYKDLVLVVMSRDTAASVVTTQFLRVNNVSSGSLYHSVFMQGSSGGATSSQSNSQNEWGIGFSAGSLASSGIYTTNIYNFQDYSSTDKQKVVLARNNAADASNGGTRATALRYADTAAITTINVLPATTFAAGSTFALYGVSA